jgi:DNA gyrase subunit A
MGRDTSGVRGIKIAPQDRVIAMEVFAPKPQVPKDKRKRFFRDMLIISEKGIGKRTPLRFFPTQKRAGKGVKAANLNERTAKLAGAVMVTEKTEQIVITSSKGQVIKLPLKNIPQLGRATQGVILMRFARKTDHVAAITTLESSFTPETA